MEAPTRVFRDLALPHGLEIESAEHTRLGETNTVYHCRGRFEGRPMEGYLKVADREARSLDNEARVLERIAGAGLPIPRVLGSGGGERPFLFVEALAGTTVWDLIDPRRPAFRASEVLANLHLYGATLARIHTLDIECVAQARTRIEDLLGEELHSDPRYREIVRWLEAHRPPPPAPTFVHGDFNTANVLLDGGQVSALLDSEFAGMGWKEYELAWALRARTHFLNTDAEREAILSGYRSAGTFEPAALQWCEVLNALHFAYWSRETDPAYEAFALDRAIEHSNTG